MQKLIKHLSLTNYKNHELFSVYIWCWQYWLKYDTPIIFIQFLHIFITENVNNPTTVKKSVIYNIVCYISLRRMHYWIEPFCTGVPQQRSVI